MQWIKREAERLLQNVKNKNKNEIVFECGFGPSGLPHIGTVSEIIRTNFVRKYFNEMTENKYNTRLIVFIDDLDALRKVPNTIHFSMIKKYEGYIGLPLCDIPSPWNDLGEDLSYSGYSVKMLQNILEQFGFVRDVNYEFAFSSNCYRGGYFENVISLFKNNVNSLKEIITYDYQKERKETYFPFFPIIDGEVYHYLSNVIIENNILYFTDINNKRRNIEINGKNLKAQWKADWPLRWIAFDVDYEMHGKDLLDSAKIGDKILRYFSMYPPVHMMYELFLDENQEKVSKSKGNGLEIDDWIEYAPIGAIYYYLTQNPRKSNILSYNVIPRTVDEYINNLQKFNNGEKNVIYLFHECDDTTPSPVSYKMCINVASITNTQDPYILLKFIQNYVDIDFDRCPMLYKICVGSIKYYNKFVRPYKIPRTPTNFEKDMLHDFYERISNYKNYTFFDDEMVNEIRSEIFDCGKCFYGKENLREYFKCMYQILLGYDEGPQLHQFVITYGIKNTMQLIATILNDER